MPRIITVDGISGSGKSTAVQAMHHWLLAEGIKNEVVKYPTGLVREQLQTFRYGKRNGMVEVYLFMADYHNFVSGMNKGDLYVTDRGIGTLIADTAYDPRAVSLVQRVQDCLKKPDLLIILDLPAEVAINRLEIREVLESKTVTPTENLYSLRRLRQSFLEIPENIAKRKIVISASGEREVVLGNVLKEVRRYLEI